MGLLDILFGSRREEAAQEPVFLKETSDAEEQLDYLKKLAERADEDTASKIEDEIKILDAGLYGEGQIVFELKNSHIPMFVLRDIYLRSGEYAAQIDFLIITAGHVFVVECKNLIGDIEIDSRGNFTRTMRFGKFFRKEGIYSPITQNKRHMEVIKAVAGQGLSGVELGRYKKYFYDVYRPVIVLANPKTVLTDRYAKKEIKDQVVRGDRLIAYIEEVDAASEKILSYEEMRGLAEFFLKSAQKNPAGFADKYKELSAAEEEKDQPSETPAAADPVNLLCPKCGARMVKRVASKGARAGKAFYGCSAFPKCRFIINIGDEEEDTDK